MVDTLRISLGATDVERTTQRELIPNGNVVRFRASAELQRMLRESP